MTATQIASILELPNVKVNYSLSNGLLENYYPSKNPIGTLEYEKYNSYYPELKEKILFHRKYFGACVDLQN